MDGDREFADAALLEPPAQVKGAGRRTTFDPWSESTTVGRVEPTVSRWDTVYKRTLVASDLTCGVAAIAIVRLIAGRQPLEPELIGALLVTIVGKLLGRYDGFHASMRHSVLDEFPSLVGVAALVSVAWGVGAAILGLRLGLSDGSIGVLWAMLLVLLTATRTIIFLGANRLHSERILVVGNSRSRRSLAHSLLADPGARVEVVGFLPLTDERRHDTGPSGTITGERRRRQSTFADLPEVVRALEVERILLIPDPADEAATTRAVLAIGDLKLRVSLVPRLFEAIGSAVDFDDVGGITVLNVRQAGLTRSSRLIKRTIDVLGAGAALLITLPAIALIALSVKLDSPGPVIFRQPRIGRRGEEFAMFKFRSMVDGAHHQRDALRARNETEGLFKLDEDPRVTKIGRVIRHASLDELPQLFNVLRGEMSLVGPRPLIPEEDALVSGRYRERLAMVPGLTGPWQILGPQRPPLTEMVKTDYLYTVNWSPWLDLKILLRTAAHILARRGR